MEDIKPNYYQDELSKSNDESIETETTKFVGVPKVKVLIRAPKKYLKGLDVGSGKDKAVKTTWVKNKKGFWEAINHKELIKKCY